MPPAINLDAYAGSRDNNFNLIRFVAAALVLVSHCWPLSQGVGMDDPLARFTGHTMGSLAVEVFFFASGFLVTGSLMARGNVLDYAAARILRIFPGLIVAIVFTVIVLGVSFDERSFGDFFTAKATLGFLFQNTTFLIRGFNDLPGIFAGNPYPDAVNGSLWTLPRELRMYCVLAALWFVARKLPKKWPGLFEPMIFCIAGVGLGMHFFQYFTGRPHGPVATTGIFFLGASAYVLRGRIRVSPELFACCLLALIASLVHREAFFTVRHLTLGYIVLWLAYAPGGAMRAFNRLGDYSYGLYIYAFPVQQAVVALVPGVSIAGLFLRAMPITLGLAIASWHLVEARALRLKGRPLPFRSKAIASGVGRG